MDWTKKRLQTSFPRTLRPLVQPDNPQMKYHIISCGFNQFFSKTTPESVGPSSTSFILCLVSAVSGSFSPTFFFIVVATTQVEEHQAKIHFQKLLRINQPSRLHYSLSPIHGTKK